MGLKYLNCDRHLGAGKAALGEESVTRGASDRDEETQIVSVRLSALNQPESSFCSMTLLNPDGFGASQPTKFWA